MESMEYIASHFVSGDVRGSSADCFSKVEDDVVYYNGADQKKKSFACRIFFFLPLFDFALMDVYGYEDKVKSFFLLVGKIVLSNPMKQWLKIKPL